MPAALDREQILQRLLAVVSDRTGYPPEMLTLDADLEADLGIDSIKRVEIAGTIVRALPLGPDVTPNMDELSASRTLGQVVDALVALADSGARPTAAAGSGRADAPSPDGARPFERPADSRIGRFVLAWGSAPIDGPSADISRDGVVVIVGEAAGAAARLAELLVRRHHRVVRLLHAERGADDRARTAPADGWLADLASPEAVARLAGAIREQHGAVAALVSLAALDRADPDGQSGVGGRSDADLTSLFLLVQAFQADLVRAAAQGGAAVLAATALGGTFAIEPVRRAPVPASGGASGLLKTLALESPAIRVKAVDLDDPRSDDVAATLLAELLAADGLVEVGYRDRQRGAPVLVPAPTGGRDGAPPLDADSVVLVTGGARGITAEAALALAQQAPGLRLVVVGRTAEPDRPEPAATADLRGPRELKGAIAEQLRRDGRVPRPATIEAAYRRLLAEREVRANLARLREAGAQVEYRACDVRDTGAFGDLIDGLYREQARIDGVIHGAGVIEDHLIRDKRLESFERVLATKAGSARVLAEKLRPERLRFLAFFGSVSGRFGNRGQGDYAAASEVLNKLAQDLDRRWPGRVVSINWGPWLSGGMVTPEVQQQFAARGVELIPVDVGCQFLADELRFGRKGEAEVIIGGASGLPAGTVTADGRAGGPTSPARSAPVDDDTASAVALPSLPLLTTGRAAGFRRDGRFELARVVGRADDAYLDDHRLDGQPVLPFAMALELMLEAAAAAEPDLAVVGVHRMRLLRGIVLDGGPRALRVVATRPTDGTTTSGHRADAPPPAHRLLSLAIVADAEPRHVHYRAEVELGARTGPLAADIPPLADGGPPPITVAEAYRAWLFHGPRFQAIAAIGAVGPGGARATLRTSLPSACLGAGAAGRWLLDPVAVDAALQVNVIWARHHWGATLLPTGFETLRIAAPLAEDGAARSADPAPIRHELRIRPESQAPVCRTDHYFAAADGRVLAVLTGMEGIGSAALNRLAGGSTR